MKNSSNLDKANSIAKKIITGMIHINYAPISQKLPFGGYKMQETVGSGESKELKILWS